MTTGPFALHLSITGNRLVFDIRRADGAPVMAHLLSLTPLRRIVKDYFTDLRQLLRGDPHRDARPHRGDRHGPARAARRGLAAS